MWRGIKTIPRPQEFYHVPVSEVSGSATGMCELHSDSGACKKKLISSIGWIYDLPYVMIVKVSRAGILLSKESNHEMKIF